MKQKKAILCENFVNTKDSPISSTFSTFGHNAITTAGFSILLKGKGLSLCVTLPIYDYGGK